MPNRHPILVATRTRQQRKRPRPGQPLIGPHGKEGGGWEFDDRGFVSGGEGKCGAKR